MTIRPTPSGPSPRSHSAGRSDALLGTRHNLSRTDAPRPGDTRAQPGEADAVHISDEARALHRQVQQDDVPSGELPADRLAGIARRIADGHYDRPDVMDLVVRRIAREL